MEKIFTLMNEGTQRLNVYHVEQMREAFASRKGKPSNRIFETKWGRNGLKGLAFIEKEYNCSWYRAVRKFREEKNLQDKEAIFYRGNVINGYEMFDKADQAARAMLAAGVEKGDEIACCMSNVPEVLYLMLAASHIGAKLNFFGSHYNPDFIDIILNGCSDKIMFATDDEAERILKKIEQADIKTKVIISLADSLPEHPENCEGYEAHLDRFYHYENKAAVMAAQNPDLITFSQFLEGGQSYQGGIVDDNDLDTEFLITYTSGSTRIGFPKREIHRNRSLITVGVFHFPELCGNPPEPGLRSMAHLHTDTDTNLITTISDAMFQQWSVAFEPEYARELFLDLVFLNKPNFVLATTCFWLQAAREYVVDRRYHDGNDKPRLLDFLLVGMAVGEALQPGEEKFINAMFKHGKAGSAVSLVGPFSLPHTTIGIGGGDTEHGGIYYSLFHKTNEHLKALQLRGKPYGMMPVPYAQATVLRKNADGTYHECDYNEYGIIVANSATTMAGYKDFEKVRSKVLTDEQGMDWLSCDVYGFIDKLGCIHMKDRRDSAVEMEDGSTFLPFRLADEAQKDSANIMTSVITTEKYEGRLHFIVNYELSPIRKTEDEMKVLQKLDSRIRQAFPEICDRILYRQFDSAHPFPVNPSGKRNMVGVQNMGVEGAFRLNPQHEMVPVILS